MIHSDAVSARGVVFVTVMMALPAMADFDLNWQAPPECPPRPDVASVLGDVWGRAQVDILNTAHAWQLTVRFDAPVTGVRQLVADTCEEATRAALLLLRLGSAGALPAPAVEAPPPPPLDAGVTPPVPEEAPWRITTTLGGALDVSALPTPGPRIAASVAVAKKAFSIAFDVRVGFTARVEATDAAVDVARPVEGQLAGCWSATFGRLVVGPCLSVAAGWWRLQGLRVQMPKTGDAALVAAGPQLRAELRLVSELVVSAVAGLRVHLTRPTPVFDPKVDVFTTSSLAADLQLALGWRW